MSECPVCYAECKDWRGYESFYVSEETSTCPNGCYCYEFSYGSSHVYITIRGHHIEFYWHYTDNHRRVQESIDILTLAARKALIEDLLKLRAPSENSQAAPRQN